MKFSNDVLNNPNTSASKRWKTIRNCLLEKRKHQLKKRIIPKVEKNWKWLKKLKFVKKWFNNLKKQKFFSFFSTINFSLNMWLKFLKKFKKKLKSRNFVTNKKNHSQLKNRKKNWKFQDFYNFLQISRTCFMDNPSSCEFITT